MGLSSPPGSAGILHVISDNRMTGGRDAGALKSKPQSRQRHRPPGSFVNCLLQTCLFATRNVIFHISGRQVTLWIAQTWVLVI
jgi:hypothetical protein